MTNDEKFMRMAIALSKQSMLHGNEPNGAILVKGNEIVMTSENLVYTKKNPTFHAEARLISEYCKESGVSDLSEYTIYSSNEPCFMCCGAMVLTNLGRLVYSVSNSDMRELSEKLNRHNSDLVFKQTESKICVVKDVLKEEGLKVIKAYFSQHKLKEVHEE